MGTGKTKIALDNACILYNRGKIDRLLVVAPKGAYMTWVEQEIPTHVPDYIEKNVLAWKSTTSAKYRAQLKNIMDISDYRLKNYGHECGSLFHQERTGICQVIFNW